MQVVVRLPRLCTPASAVLRVGLTLGTLALHTNAASAQDLFNSTALLTHFATRCGQIAADPTKAVSGIAGASARIAGDRSLIVHKEPAGPNGTIAFRQTVFPDGKNSDCALVMKDFTPGLYNDLGKLIAENGSALFGTEVAVTGSHAGEDAVQMIATSGYPPAASLTHVQSRDELEMVLSLNSAVTPTAAPSQPEPKPEPETAQAPQPQVLDVAPAPEPVVFSAQDLAAADDIVLGLAGCLNASNDPTALAPAMLEAGFDFEGLSQDGDLMFKKAGVTAQLSSSASTGLCTLTAASAPYELAAHIGEKATQLFVTAGAPAPQPATVDGCPATRLTGPYGPVTLTYLNPSFRATCGDPLGAAVRLSLQ